MSLQTYREKNYLIKSVKNVFFQIFLETIYVYLALLYTNFK